LFLAEQTTQFESFCRDLPQNTEGASKKIIICEIGKKVQRDVCRGAEFARSKFQCSRERLLVHEQKLLKSLLVHHSESQATKFRTKKGLEGALGGATPRDIDVEFFW
jgi:hypothetical protein